MADIPLNPVPLNAYIGIIGNNGMYVSSRLGQEPMTCFDNVSKGWQAFLMSDAGNGMVWIMATNNYVSVQGGILWCNKSAVGSSEMFIVVYNNDGTFSLKGYNGLYVSSNNGNGPMTCNESVIGITEKFRWNDFVDGNGPLSALQLPTSITYNVQSTTSTPTTTPIYSTPTTPVPVVPVRTNLAGFSTMEILIFLGLAGGLLYAANKKQKHG